jgi:hypothetical protein
MQGTAPTPAAAPQAPMISIGGPGQGITIIPPPGGATPAAIYEGFKNQRRELANQLESLEDTRRDLANRLQEEPAISAAEKAGVESRLTEIYARISAVDKAIADADANIARSAAVPGAIQRERPTPRQGPPEEVFVLGGMFIVIVLLPLSIALARRIWRRGVATVTSLPAELMDRLTRLEQGVDAVAVEVERIGEGQRYMARMMGEDASLRAIGAGSADPIEVKAREADAHYRR